MPRRKRRTRLSNGYGSISHLSGNRRRPYAVYPPVTKYSETGIPIRPKAIGYAESYQGAMEILVAYHKGYALPGVEIVPKKGLTFAEVYRRFLEDKEKDREVFTTRRQYESAFKNVSQLHEMDFLSISYADLQDAIDSCEKGIGTVRNIRLLFHQMYAYAARYEITDKDVSRFVKIRKENDIESGVPFTDDEIALLWLYKANKAVQQLLVMIYSGFRIGELVGLNIDLLEGVFQGGIKTSAGKNRIVPIHSGIQGIVEELVSTGGLMPCSGWTFRRRMDKVLAEIGIKERHTPHDCRHTFSYLCEKYGVPENDRKRLMGHAFNDVTNAVYGHRTVEQLRRSIEMIKIE